MPSFENNILVSILIPAYNAEKYLERAVRSACDQTYQYIEIVIVNDGSIDATGELSDKLASQDKRIKVIHKTHENTLQARKAGVYEASGEYVINLDADDYLDSSATEFYIKRALESNADIVTSACYVEKENTKVINKDNIPEGVYKSLKEKEFMFRNLIFMGSCQKPGIMDSIWGKMIRRSLLFDFYYSVTERMRFGEDCTVVYSIFRDAETICVTYNPVYYHVMNKDSVTQNTYEDFFKDLSDMRRLILRHYNGNKYYKYIKYQMDIDFIRLCFWGLNNVMDIEKDVLMPDFTFPDYELADGSRIVLYGAGKIGKTFFKTLAQNEKYKVVSWLDKNYKKYNRIRGMENVKGLDHIHNLKKEFDVVVIAVLDEEVAMNIRGTLVNEYGIDIQRILWKKPKHIVDKYVDWDHMYEDNGCF